jgi:hypothetical protein
MTRSPRKHIPPSDEPERKRARNQRNRAERARRERWPSEVPPEVVEVEAEPVSEPQNGNQAAAGHRW